MEQEPKQNNGGESRVYRNKFARFLDKQGLILVASLCVLIAGAAVILNLGGNNTEFIQDVGEDNPSQAVQYLDEYGLRDIEYADTAAAAATQRKFDAGSSERKQESTQVDPTQKPAAPKPPVATPQPDPFAGFIPPVEEGATGMVFAMDKLVYHKTLNQWMVHQGVDIAALQGTQVRAALAGTVKSVEEDRLMGHTVVIEHANGIQTTYSALLGEELPTAGAQINAGDVIGLVGNTAIEEALEGSHLHFEVRKDNELIDPKPYLPDFSAQADV